MAASCVPHLQIGAVVLGDVQTVALTEDRDLLLDVLDLILRLLQVDGLYGDDALGAIIDSFKHLRGKETGGRTFKMGRSSTLSEQERNIQLKPFWRKNGSEGTHLSKRALPDAIQLGE